MKTIHSDNEGTGPLDYPRCPLRTDLGTCGAVPFSDINSCPTLEEDGNWYFPEWCPLKNGPVIIQFERDNEIRRMLIEALETGFDYGHAEGTGYDWSLFTEEVEEETVDALIQKYKEK